MEYKKNQIQLLSPIKVQNLLWFINVNFYLIVTSIKHRNFNDPFIRYSSIQNEIYKWNIRRNSEPIDNIWRIQWKNSKIHFFSLYIRPKPKLMKWNHCRLIFYPPRARPVKFILKSRQDFTCDIRRKRQRTQLRHLQL